MMMHGSSIESYRDGMVNPGHGHITDIFRQQRFPAANAAGCISEIIHSGDAISDLYTLSALRQVSLTDFLLRLTDLVKPAVQIKSVEINES